MLQDSLQDTLSFFSSLLRRKTTKSKTAELPIIQSASEIRLEKINVSVVISHET